MTVVDVCSLRDSAAAVPLARAEFPAALAHRPQTPRTGLDDVEEHHEVRAVAGEAVHTYRRGAAFACAVLRREARGLVLVSGQQGEELWREVCAALSPPAPACD